MAQISKIKYWLLCLVPFVMCIFQYYTAYPIIGYALFWLIEGDLKWKFNAIIKNRFALLFSTFYLLYVIGLLYSSNRDDGMFNLQVKLSITVFPLLLVSEGAMDIKKQKMLIYSFITGCVITGLIYLGYATWKFFVQDIFEFQYMKFSLFLHPSYYSMYIDMAFLFVFYLFANEKAGLSKIETGLLLFSVFFLELILVLLQSKMGMFISAGLIVVLLVKYSLKHSYKIPVIMFAGMVALYFLSFHFFIGQRSRVMGAANIIITKQISAGSVESTQVRYYVWQSAIEVIKAHPVIGVGTGNETSAMVNQYLKDGYTGAAKESLNTHNQYLQTTVVLGCVGLMVLLACFLFPFIKCIKEKRFIYGTFLVIVAVNFLVEAMLETQSGTIFYGLFNSLLMFNFVV
jgi:O-antigen ligase